MGAFSAAARPWSTRSGVATDWERRQRGARAATPAAAPSERKLRRLRIEGMGRSPIDELAEPRNVEAAKDALDVGLDGIVGFAASVVDGGDDKVLKHFNVGLATAQAEDCRGVDAKFQKLLFAVHGDVDGAAPARAFNDRLAELALNFSLNIVCFGEHLREFEWVDHEWILWGKTNRP